VCQRRARWPEARHACSWRHHLEQRLATGRYVRGMNDLSVLRLFRRADSGLRRGCVLKVRKYRGRMDKKALEPAAGQHLLTGRAVPDGLL
jgi:hypothetical protein